LNVDQLQAFAPNNYLVTLTALPGQELLLRIEYDGSRFTSTTIKRMLRLLETLLTGMAVHAQEQLKALEELLNKSDVTIQSVEKKQREEFKRKKLFDAKLKPVKLSAEVNSPI